MVSHRPTIDTEVIPLIPWQQIGGCQHVRLVDRGGVPGRSGTPNRCGADSVGAVLEEKMSGLTTAGLLILLLCLLLILAEDVAKAWEEMSGLAKYLAWSLFLAGAVMVVLGQG